jgi:hypothetical protein
MKRKIKLEPFLFLNDGWFIMTKKTETDSGFVSTMQLNCYFIASFVLTMLVISMLSSE